MGWHSEKTDPKLTLLPNPKLTQIYLIVNVGILTYFRNMSRNFVRSIRIMSIESSIEQKIRDAIARGEFDDLPGKGKPIDLEAYFAMPEDMRMAFAMLKSNDFVPDEIEKLNEIARLKETLHTCTDDAEKVVLTKNLNELSLSITLLLEARKRRR